MPISENGSLASGHVVVVPFPYTDRDTTRRRPAIVVSGPAVHRHGIAWLVMVTSAENPAWIGDIALPDHAAVGLPVPSVIRPAKIATVEIGFISRRIGTLPPALRRQLFASLQDAMSDLAAG
jgi:mRNA interferase MazF